VKSPDRDARHEWPPSHPARASRTRPHRDLCVLGRRHATTPAPSWARPIPATRPRARCRSPSTADPP